MVTKNKRKWRTVREVAEAEEVSDRAVRKRCEQGKYHALKTVGGHYRIYDTAEDLKAASKASLALVAMVLF